MVTKRPRRGGNGEGGTPTGTVYYGFYEKVGKTTRDWDTQKKIHKRGLARNFKIVRKGGSIS